MQRNKKFFLIFIFFIIITGIFIYLLINKNFFNLFLKIFPFNYRQAKISNSLNNSLIIDTLPTIENRPLTDSSFEKIILPDRILIDVPFTSQAPTGIWDNLHNEACEEAALIMAKYWLKGQFLTKELAEKEIQEAIKWQEENWGGHFDLPVERVLILASNFFKINNLEIIYQPTVDQIKEALNGRNLVLVPTAGRLLNNPYYRQPGPIYHFLVIKGYDSKSFFTNDPGTRRGKDFVYSVDTVLSAIHDWPYPAPGFGSGLSKDEQAQAILNSPKAILIVQQSQ